MCHGEELEAMQTLCYLGSAIVRDFILNTSVLFCTVATSSVPFKKKKRQPKKKSSHRNGVTMCRTT